MEPQSSEAEASSSSSSASPLFHSMTRREAETFFSLTPPTAATSGASLLDATVDRSIGGVVGLTHPSEVFPHHIAAPVAAAAKSVSASPSLWDMPAAAPSSSFKELSMPSFSSSFGLSFGLSGPPSASASPFALPTLTAGLTLPTLPPPPQLPAHVEAYSSFSTTFGDLLSTPALLPAVLLELGVQARMSSSASPKLKCSFHDVGSSSSCTFRISLFASSPPSSPTSASATSSASSSYVVEVQRRSGCGVLFHTLYARMTRALSARALITSPFVASPSPSVSPSASPSASPKTSPALAPLSLPSSMPRFPLALSTVPSFSMSTMPLPPPMSPLSLGSLSFGAATPSLVPSSRSMASIASGISLDAATLRSLVSLASARCADVQEPALAALAQAAALPLNHRLLAGSSALLAVLPPLLASSNTELVRLSVAILAPLATTQSTVLSTLAAALPSLVSLLASTSRASGVTQCHVLRALGALPSALLVRSFEHVDKLSGIAHSSGVLSSLAVRRSSAATEPALRAAIAALFDHMSL